MSANNHLKTPLARSSLFVMILMLVVACAAFIGSGMVFSGYLGGGRSVIGVIQAFLLCFGAGALIYGPALAIFNMARSVRANGPKRGIGALTTLLALPVWAYGGLTLIIYPAFWIWGLAALCIGLYLTFWAVVVLKHGK